jgi:hypothetical protein
MAEKIYIPSDRQLFDEYLNTRYNIMSRNKWLAAGITLQYACYSTAMAYGTKRSLYLARDLLNYHDDVLGFEPAGSAELENQ